MNNPGPLFWLILTLLCITIHAFFSMIEMACVSFDKARLNYYVSKKKNRALWLNSLLKNPSYLFGTTLLCVNIAIQVGSECSRQFYASINLPENLAPITQIILVSIFAELSPMLAAYRHSEHTAFLGMPILYATSKMMTPLIWSVNIIVTNISALFGKSKKTTKSLFNRNELQKIFEGYEETHLTAGKGEELNYMATNIFQLRGKTARHIMTPIKQTNMIKSNNTIEHAKQLLEKIDQSFLLVYQKTKQNVIGIIKTHQLISRKENQSIHNLFSPPWFISEQTPILQILQQFRYNRQDLAVVLGRNGLAKGMLSLDDILNQILGKHFIEKEKQQIVKKQPKQIIEKTILAETKIKEFNEQFNTKINEEEDNFARLIEQKLDHIPKKGDIVRLDQFEITVTDASLLGAKTIFIKTIS